MLGIPKDNPLARVLNFIILTFKFYTYRQKLYHEAQLDITAFLREFRNKLKIEQYICTLEGKEDTFGVWNRALSVLG